MALSNETKAAILAEVASVGLVDTTKQIQAAYVAARLATAQTSLAAAVSMSIADWPSVETFFAAGVSATGLYPIRDQIAAKIASRNANGLGILLLTFYAADKAHRG